MKTPHDRYDSLAGAMLLGEASETERAEYAAHAAGCALCAQDLCAPPLAQTLGRLRDAETWRPSLDRAVIARVVEARDRRWRWTFGALGGAAALSLVLNLAFVSGIGARFANAFAPQPAEVTSPLAGAHLIRLPADTFANVRRRAPEAAAPVLQAHLAPRVLRAAAPLAVHPGPRASAEPPLPDFFSGIDLAGNDPRAGRSMAAESWSIGHHQ